MQKTITVKGTGKVSAKPDYVILSMRLEALDMEYEKAMERAAVQIGQLTDSLKGVGFEREAVKTTSFNVRTVYNSVQGPNGNYTREFGGFECSHGLKVEFDFDSERLALALSAVADSLSRPEMNIAFTVKDAARVDEELLRSAAVNARRKAEVLCKASGVALGELQSIDYNWGELNLYSQTRYAVAEDCLRKAAPMARTIEVEPENIEVQDTAAFVWEICQEGE